MLISGNGSNLQAIIDACEAGDLAAEIALVLSHKADVYGLERARRHGIPWQVLPLGGEARSAYDQRLAETVAAQQPDYIVLAGWLRLLTMNFLQHFPHKVVNLHPALPGAFAGLHAIERSYQAFQKDSSTPTGVMVHLVPDEGVDTGPVLASAEVDLEEGESLEAFTENIHRMERRLLVSVLQTLSQEALA